VKTLKWMITAILIGPSVAIAGELVNGLAKRVGAVNGKVTVKHGDIKDLGMPARAMVFELKDPAWAPQPKPGQVIQFQAKDLGGGKLEIEVLQAKSN